MAMSELSVWNKFHSVTVDRFLGRILGDWMDRHERFYCILYLNKDGLMDLIGAIERISNKI